MIDTDKTFADLMAGHASAEILCLFRGTVVRRLVVIDETVDMIADNNDQVGIPLKTPIFFEPWFMDRGNMLFKLEGNDEFLKLCTEADFIKFEDGTKVQVERP